LAVPVIIKGFKDRNSTRRRGAANALQRIGPDARAAVPALIEALQDGDLMFDAAMALGAIGPGAKAAVPALKELIKKRKAEGVPFWWAADSLEKIDPDAVAKAAIS
jgi:HEAT repeat protein